MALRGRTVAKESVAPAARSITTSRVCPALGRVGVHHRRLAELVEGEEAAAKIALQQLAQAPEVKPLGPRGAPRLPRQRQATHKRIHSSHKARRARRHRHHCALHAPRHLLPLAQGQGPPRLELAQHRDILLLLALTQRARAVYRVPPEAQGQLHLRRSPILDLLDVDTQLPQESCKRRTFAVDHPLKLTNERDVVHVDRRLQSQNHL